MTHVPQVSVTHHLMIVGLKPQIQIEDDAIPSLPPAAADVPPPAL